MGLGFSEKNWKSVLESLGFSEIKNPNGYNCYDVLNEEGFPMWQYETEKKKEQLYYFLTGALYWKLSHNK